MNQTIAVERIDHIGIRVRDLLARSSSIRLLGFELLHRAEGDEVAIVHNENGVELNLIFNANASEPNTNVLMDAPDKFPGYTHMALRVGSIPATIAALRANDVSITEGPVSFGLRPRSGLQRHRTARPRSGRHRRCNPLGAIAALRVH